MSSIISGYNYDIFISYRQKDNKGDKWVGKFVEALKIELEGTFKEDISIYFDENPHDRLQETYNVDKSLEGKLKCLVFIPILSQTYCDPNSYAWKDEFLAFLRLAQNDQFGKDIRIRGGNVTSRILPIRIHDIEPEDVKLFEKETGSTLRAMDFVFRTATGVSRPLLPNEDHPHDNLNKIYYRDQISKVARAIKEIILGMNTGTVLDGNSYVKSKENFREARKDERTHLKEHFKKNKYIFLTSLLIFSMMIVVAISWPKIHKRDSLEILRTSSGKISVVVMPFQNMTNDTTWNVWQDGIKDMLITSFSDNPEELSVRQTESVNSLIQDKEITNYASLTPSLAGNISQKLDADMFVYGKIIKAGPALRIYSQLIDSRTKEVIKSFQMEGLAKEEKIFSLIDSLSKNIKDFLIIKELKKEVMPDYQNIANTNSPEAYRLFIQGEKARINYNDQEAAGFYSQALKIDTSFYLAGLRLSISYFNIWRRLSKDYQNISIDSSKKWCLFIYNKRNGLPLQLKLQSEHQHAILFETPYEELKYLRQLQEIDDQSPTTYFYIAQAYSRLQLYDKAIPYFEKTLKIYKNWNIKPYRAGNYFELVLAYRKTDQLKKARRILRTGEIDFPESRGIFFQHAVLDMIEGDTVEANKYFEKINTIWKEIYESDVHILGLIEQFYEESNVLNKAEECLRKTISIQPGNPLLYYNLAYFLIDKKRNYREGLELLEKARKLNLDDWHYTDCMGYGLLKQGKYKDALVLLEKSDSLKPYYDHDRFLHLEAAKKAVAE